MVHKHKPYNDLVLIVDHLSSKEIKPLRSNTQMPLTHAQFYMECKSFQ